MTREFQLELVPTDELQRDLDYCRAEIAKGAADSDLLAKMAAKVEQILAARAERKECA
jgi:hypothetical protein